MISMRSPSPASISVPISTLGGLLIAGLAVSLLQATPQLQGLAGPLTISATQSGELRQADALVDQMRREGTLRLTDVTRDPLAPGRVHQRLSQYHLGVRVLGGGISRQTEPGATTSVFGHIHGGIAIGITPAISSQQAADTAGGNGGRVATPPELVIAGAAAATDYRLVYRVQTFGPTGLVESHIDALTGDLVMQRSNLHTQAGSGMCSDCAVGEGRGVKGDRKKLSVRDDGGVFRTDDGLRSTRVSTYDMRGDWRRAIDVLNGLDQLTPADLATDADNLWEDGASVDAHAGAGWTLDYLAHRFGRAGLDGNSTPIVAMVHPVDRADLFTVPRGIAELFHLNAFFCVSCGPSGTVVFGEGLPVGQTLGPSGQTLDYFSAGIDIVAHELGHAVTEFSSRLIYQDESGALNEAFSDLLGAGTEFFMAESGRHRVEQADYLIGEDVVQPIGIRSLSNPRSRGDPDHYSLRFLGDADNGGVHTNSTIATHAYYLAVEGGTNLTSGVRVSGLGADKREIVEQIFYRAFVFLLPEDATFSMARAATLQSARDVADDPEFEQTIATAWTAVGVE